MKVVYTAPNRAHHYQYALSLYENNILHAFVSGFPRFSPRANLIEIGDKLHRVDTLQTIYLAALKMHMPEQLTSFLGYKSKIEQDLSCQKYLKGVDVFLFYNGSGLNSCRYAKKDGTICIVEVVNSHVQYQEDLLEDEYRLLNLRWKPFYDADKKRRITEYNEADYILLPSDFVRNSFIQRGFPPEKLLKLPYGFKKTFGNKENCQEKKKDSFTILYVGSISVRKGLRYLIEAFRLLKHPHKKLLIVGPKTKITGIDNLNFGSDVIFRGALKGVDLENAYKSADLFCIPSIEEGLALVQGEALSFGLPIITTENTGGSDLITDGKEGFILPIRNSRAIYEKLQFLADNNNIFNIMKIAVQKKIGQLKGWEETGKELCNLLNNISTKG